MTLTEESCGGGRARSDGSDKVNLEAPISLTPRNGHICARAHGPRRGKCYRRPAATCAAGNGGRPAGRSPAVNRVNGQSATEIFRG